MALAPRPRRKRIRAIVLILTSRAQVELDNANDGTIYELSTATLARALPLDNVADNERTVEQEAVCECLEEMEDTLTTGEPSDQDVVNMLDDLKVYLTAAGL